VQKEPTSPFQFEYNMQCLKKFYTVMKYQTFVSYIPKWFVANCSSMLSLDSEKGVAVIPALFLEIQQTNPKNTTATVILY